MTRRAMGAVVLALALLAGVGCSTSAGVRVHFDGHRWRVVEVKELVAPKSDVQVPDDEHAWIAFDGQGHLTAYDLIGHYAIRYRATATSFLPTGYKGSWSCCGTVPAGAIRIASAIASIIGDRFHPVAVAGTTTNRITMTAYYHHSRTSTVWHPTVELICTRDD